MGRHAAGRENRLDLTRRQVVLFWLALVALNAAIAVAGFSAGVIWGLVDRAMASDPRPAVSTVPAPGVGR